MKTSKIIWQSPSNIAFVKYWGKMGIQLPANPSLSMTLKNSYTTTSIEWECRSQGESVLKNFLFHGKIQANFSVRIEKYLHLILNEIPELQDYSFTITSENSFPHSAGIASSASFMSSLALALCSFEELITDKKKSESQFFQKASRLARLGSGSASRSVFGGYTVWGSHPETTNFNDEFAASLDEVDPVFNSLHDAILLVSSSPKKVSSTAGHQLMNNHPYRLIRYQSARENLIIAINALKSGDITTLFDIIEKEALALHGLMMLSSPPFLLLEGNSVSIIQKIKEFKEASKIPVTYTIDAGPNIHLIYPESSKLAVENFITHELVQLCENQQVIFDQAGKGPIKIEP